MKTNVTSLSSYKMNYQVDGEGSLRHLLTIFETNYLNGKKNIAISSTHYHSLQQKLILAALQFFNQKYPSKKIGVISFSCDSGNFLEFSAHANATKELGINNFGGFFDLISWDYVIENKLEASITGDYDLLFWELPELEKISNMAEDLKESLAIVDFAFFISNRLATQNDAEFAANITQYFVNHGVSIDSLMVPVNNPNIMKIKKAS